MNKFNNDSIILTLLILFGTVLISFVAVLGISLGLGWLLTQVISFTLFEATLLSLLIFVFVLSAWYRLLFETTKSSSELEEILDEFEIASEEIPKNRFYKTEREKTWQAWFHYLIANTIYDEFQMRAQAVNNLNKQQQQELAIRLADVIVEVFKRKPANTKRFHLSKIALTKQMQRIGQRPYDDDILELAIERINESFQYNPMIQQTNKMNRWQDTSPMFD